MKIEIVLEPSETSKIHRCPNCRCRFVAIYPKGTNSTSCPNCDRRIYIGNYNIGNYTEVNNDHNK